jgi:hypothetical protein
LTTFPGGTSYTIPTGIISSLGKVIMTPGIYYPAAPNVPGAAVSTNNYSYSSATILKYNQQNYRIDQNIGSKDQIFFHMTWHDENETNGAPGSTPSRKRTFSRPI